MNWYQKTKNPKKDMKPYKIYRVCHGQDKYLGIIINSYSPEQARFKALQEYSWLNDYFQIEGCEIIAKVDAEKLQQRNLQNNAEVELQKMREERTQSIYE